MAGFRSTTPARVRKIAWRSLVDGGDDAGGIAGLIVGGFPGNDAGGGIERDDSGVWSAQVDDYAAGIDQRRAGGSEPSFFHSELLAGGNGPFLFSGGEIDGGEHSFGAEGVDDSAGDDGSGAWAFIEAEVVAISGGVFVGPNVPSSYCVQRFNDFATRDAMEQDHFAGCDYGGREAFADVLFPDDGRAGGGEAGGDVIAGVCAVTRRP